MKYRVGFKNGMVLVIEAESVSATGNSNVVFLKGDNKDNDIYVFSFDVLFVAPLGSSNVERGAAAPTSSDKK